jgi:hypothetical protein
MFSILFISEVGRNSNLKEFHEPFRDRAREIVRDSTMHSIPAASFSGGTLSLRGERCLRNLQHLSRRLNNDFFG